MVQKRKCIAKTSAGNPCGRWAVKGATVCQSHGAAAPAVKAKAAVRAELMDWGLADVKEDPGEVLLRLITQSSRRVVRLSDELQRKVEEQGLELAIQSGLARAESDERDRLAGFATKGIAAGLKEREVRVAEKQVEIVGDIVSSMLAAMNASPDQLELAKVAYDKKLLELEAGTG